MISLLSQPPQGALAATQIAAPWPRSEQAEARLADEPLLTLAERTALQRGPWFAALPVVVRHDILRHCSVRRLVRGGEIHADDEDCVRLDAVASGAIRVGLRRPGTPTLEYLPAGSWFVDPGMFGGCKRLLVVATHGRATIASVRTELLVSLLRRHRCLHAALSQLSLHRLEQHFEILHELSTLALPARLARCIGRLSRSFGQPVEEGVRIALPLKQGALADLVRASRQRLNQQLKILEAQGIVRVQRELVVTNPRALEDCGSHSRSRK